MFQHSQLILSYHLLFYHELEGEAYVVLILPLQVRLCLCLVSIVEDEFLEFLYVMGLLC